MGCVAHTRRYSFKKQKKVTPETDTSPPPGLLRSLRVSLIDSDRFLENRLPAVHSHNGEATVAYLANGGIQMNENIY